MKKADNFDAKQWLIENKITFQSRLNEAADIYPYRKTPEEVTLYDKIANELEGTISMVANKLGVPKSDIRISLDYLWDDMEVNKNKKKGMFVQVKADDAEWGKAWAGNALLIQTTNKEGIVIPSNPFYGISINGQKNPKVRSLYNKALDLDLEDLVASENARIADLVSDEEMKIIAPNTPVVITGKGMNESKLNEDLTSQIAALPDFETSPDTEEATLVVGNYAVVHYDQTDEGGEDMYVVWDNTRNQDEIGSYDDEPEFESADPAEVAAFLKKNESLNEVENLPTRAEMFDDFEKMAQDLKAKTGAKIRTVHFPNQFRFDVEGDMMGWWDGQFDVPIARRNPSTSTVKRAYDAVNKWVANFPAQYKDYLSWKAKGEEAFDQEVNRRRKEFFGN
jgi:hypothetical protein